MPFAFWRGAFNDTPYGRCDSCGDGSVEDISYSIELLSLNEDGHDPWYCFSCYDMYWAEHSREEAVSVPEYWDEDGTERRGPRYRGDDREFNGDQDIAGIEENYSFDTDHNLHDPIMLLPVIDGRESRLISCEQELGSGGNEITELLFRNKFCLERGLLPYHSRDTPPTYLCKVEEDSSVDSEIIYQKMDLSQMQVANNFERALGLVKDAIGEGQAKIDMRCGFHTHVGINNNPDTNKGGYGMKHVESLYHLWNYLEDPIFRLASANWPCHRTERAYHNYAMKTPKNLVGRAGIGIGLERDRYAINFGPYFNSRGYCNCGAFAFDSWEDCVCDLPKATVEFRVFNATANLKKIHAYTALSLALVEYAYHNADNADEISQWIDNPNAFSVTMDSEPSIVPSPQQEKTKEGLDFILNRLPLTDSERKDLVYCAEGSSLAHLL